jgi:hypothetical protein
MTRQVSIQFTGGELLLKEGNKVLAKRQDGKWLSLVPGLVVTVTEDVDACTITLERGGWIERFKLPPKVIAKIKRDIIAELRSRIKQDGPLASEKLKRLLKGKSPAEVNWWMTQLGYVRCPDASIAEMYHDAVRRGDDPHEIAWLKAQWLKAEKESMQ